MKRFFIHCLAALTLASPVAVAPTALAELSKELEATADQEWQAYIDNLRPMGRNVAALMHDPEDPLLRQEVYRMLFAGLSVGYMGRFLGTEENPDLWPMLTMASHFWAPNPDNVYYLAPIDPRGTYRLSGNRGTVRIVDIQLGAGDVIPQGTGSLGPVLANHELDALHIEKDGTFSILLSAQKPADHTGNWLKLDDTVSYLLIRQIAYDWVKEVDGRFAIERLDTPAIKPRLSAEEIETNLKLVGTWAENWGKVGPAWVNKYWDEGLVNKLKVGLMSSGGTTLQHYIEGLFELEPDEALIYETEVPRDCRYWNIQLTDTLWQPLDYMNRQVHLNGHLARIDEDGKFRAVISARDPGVHNWLDTAGYSKGSFDGRWRDCSSYPLPTLTRVKFADLRKHLPEGTPTITAEEREADIRERKRGAQLRRRW